MAILLEVAKLKHDSWVISVRYSPDGTLLATGSREVRGGPLPGGLLVRDLCRGSADKCIRIFDVTSPEAKLVQDSNLEMLRFMCYPCLSWDRLAD